MMFNVDFSSVRHTRVSEQPNHHHQPSNVKTLDTINDDNQNQQSQNRKTQIR